MRLFSGVHRLNNHLPVVTFFAAVAARRQLLALAVDHILETAILALVNAGVAWLGAYAAQTLILLGVVGVGLAYCLGTAVKGHVSSP